MGPISPFTEVLFVLGEGDVCVTSLGRMCWALTHLQGPSLPHSSTRGFERGSEMTPSGKARPLQRPQPRGTNLRSAPNSLCTHQVCSQHGEATSDPDITVSGWFRTEVLCVVISPQVSFQDSQEIRECGAGRGTEHGTGASPCGAQTLGSVTTVVFTPSI